MILRYVSMVSSRNRVKQEQIRKRRNNLLRRHNDFWRLYAIRSWTTLEMPNGRIYTYRSHPHIPAPTDREIRERPQPAVHKTPADYGSPCETDLVLPTVPSLKVLGRQSQLWDLLAKKLSRLCLNDHGANAITGGLGHTVCR
ncbi:hypothetical protein NYO67_4593 [Aspergillus flavus]|nr:hypothetical protein NYO67_4593 [Aspergillus flavus]